MDQQVISFFDVLVEKGAVIAVAVAIALVAQRLIIGLANKVLENSDVPNASIFINILKTLIWSFALLSVMKPVFNVDPSGLIAALGVVSVAISLGLQDTLSNLIGGIQMTLMGVVRPGDNIEIGSETGVVTDVGLRHTTIITKLGETVIVPNSVISKTSLVQLPPAEQFKVPFCATGDASKLDEIAAEIAERAKAAAESVSPVTQEPKVFFSEITEYGFRGSIVMRVEDSAATGSAADAVVRAIAPLTR